MSRSNFSALDSKFGNTLPYAHPNFDNGLVNRSNTLHCLLEQDSDQTSSCATLVPDESASKWTDCTLTGSYSDRLSTNSWGMDEADFEKEMAEKVRKKFDTIEAAFYDRKSTGKVQIDEECLQWSTTFPHLIVCGNHLLDTMDDGTDMVDPDPFLVLHATSGDASLTDSSQELEVTGKRLLPKTPDIVSGRTHLVHEEIIAADGVIEEYFAFDNSADESVGDSHLCLRRKRHHALPPLTPNAAVKDTVCNLVFDQIWNETVAMLQPLVAMMREKSSGYHSSEVAIGDVSLPPLAAPRGNELLPPQTNHQRGMRDPPMLTKAAGPSGAKFLRLKHSGKNPPSSTLPQIADNLSGVMQIKSVSLQHRMPSMLNDISREGTPTPSLYGRPDTGTGSRFPIAATPLPSRLSDFQLPGTRLMSSRVLSRRNVTLKPIDRPKTPALEPIDNCVRGYRLSTTLSIPSPPSTPLTRNNQLPPLEPTASNTTQVGSMNSFEKSPPFQIRTSAREKNRVTFNSRMVSSNSGDFHDVSRNKFEELRPNTTSNSYRQEGPSKFTVGRKLSDHVMHLHNNMKVVGHAAGHHSATESSGGVDVVASKERFTTSIAEDDDMFDGDKSTFTITGTSGYFQTSRPSAKTKLRGYVR